MTKSNKKFISIIKIVFPLLLTLSWLGFIFGNSMQTGTVSGETSGRVHALVNIIPELLGLGSPISHLFVRKAAHFMEFAILAALVCTDLWCFRAITYTHPVRRSLPVILLSVPTTATCAAIDELIQNFSEGRGPSVKDVIIDTSGALFATILFALTFYIIRYYTINSASKITINK